MSLLDKRNYFKPFNYPWAYEGHVAQRSAHWHIGEIPLRDDVSDWNMLNVNEKNLLTQIFRFFTTADVDVAQGYMQKYGPIFGGQPEIAMMMATFAGAECFDNETELLTSGGWVNVSEINYETSVAQYNINTEEISFTQPLKVHNYKYSGVMHHYCGDATNLCITPNHDLILKNPHTGLIKKYKSEQGTWGRNYKFPNSGTSVVKDGKLSWLDRLIIAIQADGCLRGMCPSSKKTEKTCDFNLTKERKKEYLEEIFSNLNINYSKRDKDKGVIYTFCVPEDVDITKIKSFEYFNLNEFSQLKAIEFIDEVLKWDGTVSKTVKCYYNTNKCAVDKVQAIAVLAGISAVVSVNRDSDSPTILPNGTFPVSSKTCYVISFSSKYWRIYPYRKEVEYDGNVYCVSVPQQNVVSRRNGKVCITGNSIHIEAYAALIDTLNMPDTEFKAFMEYQAMKDKHAYLDEFNPAAMFDVLNNEPAYKAEIAKTLAVYSAFTEGLQLFSSFAILMNFPRFNKMKNMGKVVTWSIRDETLHVNYMIKLFNTFIDENPKLWNNKLKSELYTICEEMVEMEDRFIDLAFELDGIEGLTSDEVKQYVRHIADRRLLQLKLKPLFKVKHNPLPWLDEILNSHEHGNFFEVRASEYSKGMITGSWEDVWNKPNLVTSTLSTNVA